MFYARPFEPESTVMLSTLAIQAHKMAPRRNPFLQKRKPGSILEGLGVKYPGPFEHLYLITKQPAPAPHLARPERRAAITHMCSLLCPVSAALASLFQMDSISTSYMAREPLANESSSWYETHWRVFQPRAVPTGTVTASRTTASQ